MWERFWTEFSKAMLMTDPLAYGLYVAWCLEDRGQGELAVARPRTKTLAAFDSTLAGTHMPRTATS